MIFQCSFRFLSPLLLLLPGLVSCNTGIESTKTVKMSRAEERLLTATEEEQLGERLKGRPLHSWKIGDRFIITDDKAKLLFRISGSYGDNLEGSELQFSGVEKTTGLDGASVYDIIFSDKNGVRFVYPSGKNDPEDLNSVSSTDIPMLVDPSIAMMADSLLRGRKVWVMSELWYDSDEEIAGGKKFIPVEILEVKPGNTLFPMKVAFQTADSNRHFLWMSTGGRRDGSSRYGSRPLSSLISFSDPRLKHPEITDETWALICEGKVAPGMTKAECRLSLGNPNEVSSGHDWNATLDIWQYADGRFLRFRDGLLVDSHN